MQIHSIMIARNEADIIDQTLRHATEWCDHIYVVDNGSIDGTWDQVLSLSKHYPQIVPHKQDCRVFNNWMRGEVFHTFLDKSQSGDWWCRLDADEFYVDNPRIFLRAVPVRYQAVWAACLQYYFTDKDLEHYRQYPNAYADQILIENKCRYYLNNWSENRFFRYDENMIWEEDNGWPYFGAVYPKRIRLKHFQYRSPEQMQRRAFARLEARSKGSESFRHEAAVVTQKTQDKLSHIERSLILDDASNEFWKYWVKDSSNLDFDHLDNNYIVREELMPPVPRSYFPVLENRLRYFKKYFNKKKIKKILSSVFP